MLLQANALHIPLADGSVHCAITSPPYWGLRDYNVPGQLGLEPTPNEYVANMVAVFREVGRVLRDDGTVWLNLGDSYNSIGHKKSSSGYGSSTLAGGEQTHSPLRRENTDPELKHKDLVGIPWRVAFALQADGWYLRSDIIWAKPNPMPESVTDRPTKSHEYLFLLTKQPRYFYDSEAVKEPAQIHEGQAGRFERSGAVGEHVIPGQSAAQHRPNRNGKNGHANRDGRDMQAVGNSATRNRRSVWTIATAPFSGAHFATFPPALVEPCILAGTSAHGVCPACGAPWDRVTSTTGGTGKSWHNHKNDMIDGQSKSRLSDDYQRRTTGWRPTCACGRADVVPGIVLDPFNGSGTTGMVARQHGRRYVGLDINGTYLRDLALPRAEGKQAAASMATLPMFGAKRE